MDGVQPAGGITNGAGLRIFGGEGIQSELNDEIVEFVVYSFVGDAV